MGLELGNPRETGSSASPAERALGGARQVSDYLRALRARWQIVALATVVAAGAAFGVSLTSPNQYDATAKILLDTAEPIDALLGQGTARSNDPERDINTGVALIRLDPVAKRVQQELGLALSLRQLLREVKANTQGNSNVVEITVRDPVPERATAIANGFASEYVAFRRSSARGRYNDAARLAQKQLESLTPAKRTTAEGRALQARLEELQIAATLQTGGSQFVQQAAVPTSRATPRPKRSAAVGIFLGLVLGSLFAILLEFADHRLKDEEEIERLLELPILAKVPHIKRGIGGGPRHGTREAYSTLAINLRLMALGTELRTVMVASAELEEGKSSLTLGAGRALASIGLRVIAIESDLRKPTFARYLDLPESGGVTMICAGLSSLEDELIEIDDDRVGSVRHGADGGSFSVVPAGRIAPDPHRLLSSHRMQELVAEARERADVVLIDTPALGAVSDALSLSNVVDTCIFVVRLNHAKRDGTLRALRTLSNVGVDVTGIVITGTQSPPAYYAEVPRTQGQVEQVEVVQQAEVVQQPDT